VVKSLWWCIQNTDEAGALCGLERVRVALECRIAIAGLPVFTASFGLATVFGPIEFNGLVHNADMALLEAKRTWRKVCIAGKPQMAQEPIVPVVEGTKIEVCRLLKVDVLNVKEDVSLKNEY
jgi:hypothetical protein